MAAYTASKHGLVGFLETVRIELEESGSSVTLSLVHPGAVDTPLWNNLESSTGLLPPEPPHPAVYSAESVAEAVLNTIRHPRDELTAGGLARVQVLFYSLFGGAAKRAMQALARLEHTAGDRPAGEGGLQRRQGRGRDRAAASAAGRASPSRRSAPGTGCCGRSDGAERDGRRGRHRRRPQRPDRRQPPRRRRLGASSSARSSPNPAAPSAAAKSPSPASSTTSTAPSIRSPSPPATSPRWSSSATGSTG